MVTLSSDHFLDIFCVYTQSSDAMGLTFRGKLTVCFKAKIYAGFILLKKCARFNNRMYNGMSSFVRKMCFIQEHRWRASNYRQQKKVVGAASFSFHICRYKEQIIMLHDLLLF